MSADQRSPGSGDGVGRRGDRQRPPARERSAQHRSDQRPAERARHTDPARLAAYTVLREVAGGAYANLILPKMLRDKQIQGRDAAFATELAYGSLRMAGLYDAVIASAAARKTEAIDANVLDTLRLGAHQLLSMRVPTHAAVDETVALARQVNGAGASGFVNAVMRRISERPLQDWLTRVTADAAGPLESLAVSTSHPLWVVKAMRAALIGHGVVSAAEAEPALRDLLEADNAAAKVALVARPGLVTVAELVESGAQRSRTSPVGATVVEGDPGHFGAVRDGRAAVQDEGSQLLTLALAAASVSGDAADHERWLDLCAGPGGKAGLLGAIAVGKGIPFVANEINPRRAELVCQTLAATRDWARQRNVSVELRQSDGRDVGGDEPAAYSRVLVDAPCTGLGALRRRPEVRWRRQPTDVAALATLQRELLASAISATASGGVIGYATCSPHLNETRFVVGDVLKKRDDVEIADARELFVDASGAQLNDLGEGPYVQLWPHVHGTDAMFFALLRKR